MERGEIEEHKEGKVPGINDKTADIKYERYVAAGWMLLNFVPSSAGEGQGIPVFLFLTTTC